jgi:hypothetical protein
LVTTIGLTKASTAHFFGTRGVGTNPDSQQVALLETPSLISWLESKVKEDHYFIKLFEALNPKRENGTAIKTNC